MADSIGDILVRLSFFNEGDALDFKNTGRAVLVVEDGVAELPLPKGEQGPAGERGPAGAPLRPDIILDEKDDSMALEKLKSRGAEFRAKGVGYQGYFALNKPTMSAFFYTRGGWVVVRDIFGGRTEITAGEFSLPVKVNFVEEEPPTPIGGITLFAHNGELKIKKPDGSVKVL